MARDHARLYHRVWADPEFRALEESAQRMFFVVLSQPDLNYCGVASLSVHRWASLAADSSTRKVTSALNRLVTSRFILTDGRTQEVMVRSFVRNDGLLSSPNICINVTRTFPSILSPCLRATFLIELHRLNLGEQQSGWDKGWAQLAPLLSQPLPEGLPEGFLEQFPQGIPKPLSRAAIGPAPAPVLSPQSSAGSANPSGQPADAQNGAALARQLMAAKEPTPWNAFQKATT